MGFAGPVMHLGLVGSGPGRRLVRKWNLSWAGGSVWRRVSADGLGLAGWGQEFADVGVEGLDGDLAAEAFEVADVVAGLAAGVHALLVVVGAEVGVAGCGVGQQGVDDGEHGVAGRDQGLVLRHPPGQAPVFRAGAGLGAAGLIVADSR